MSVRSHRLAVAVVIAATAIAVPTAALASDSGTSSGKPAPSAAATKSAASKSAASKSAASKSAAAGGSAAASKFAARQSGVLRSVTMPAMVTALATQLGVSHSAAQRAFNQLDALSGGVDSASPAFAAIARDLGVSPAQLTAALGVAKQAARQSVAGR